LIHIKLSAVVQIESKILYEDKFNIIEPYKEIYFKLSNLRVDDDYIALIFIKIEDVNEEEVKYYTLTYDINHVEKEKDYSLIISISISIVIFIICLILFYIIYRKLKIKNSSLQDKVKAISFSNGINEELNINKESNICNEEYENTFI